MAEEQKERNQAIYEAVKIRGEKKSKVARQYNLSATRIDQILSRIDYRIRRQKQITVFKPRKQ